MQCFSYTQAYTHKPRVLHAFSYTNCDCGNISFGAAVTKYVLKPVAKFFTMLWKTTQSVITFLW